MYYKIYIKNSIRQYLNEENNFTNKKSDEIFFRKTMNPKDDLIRNFSCYHNAYFNSYEEGIQYFEKETTFSQPIKQDPITKKWCGHVESGLSAYIVRNKKEFNFALDELINFYPHLKDIKNISVFISNDYYLEDGSDGEDIFKNVKFLFNIPFNINYNDYIDKLNKFIKN